MASAAVQHLERRVAGRHPDLPASTAGSLRLDLRDGGQTEHWYLTIEHQDVRVTRSAEDAELVVRADREVFDRMAEGRLHPAAALLRNDLTVQGNLRLLLTLRRLFPGPSGARDPRAAGCGGGGR
ncbi:SCP2 sterol-binding domain-containing protein [Micromonospora soli]|uniref:SCP2 sterol-binding domain-containing protein n=1 Tax=Micromonospora sp. NBRC 110009 TaxID=3061627 RepID=UPI002673DD19|nr:SCP2 sterol-binding domain-containing protein [Micromonospora sp. NBRC 110009]WKT99143.1 SCP2 sterol-binding domain-containing protein [Micromonospora sp. NBRC 110009]